MLEKPLDPSTTLEETIQFCRALVQSGLPITEMNALRKHFSRVKGGRLAVAAQEATQCTLLVSDVPENVLHVSARDRRFLTRPRWKNAAKLLRRMETP